jgi:hypothetical protein
MDTGALIGLLGLTAVALAGRKDAQTEKGGPVVSTNLVCVVNQALAMAPPVAGLIAGTLLGLKRVQAVGVGKPWSEGTVKLVYGVHIDPLTWWGLTATARGKFRVTFTHRQGTDPIQGFMSTPLYQELVASKEYQIEVPVLGGVVGLGGIVQVEPA